MKGKGNNLLKNSPNNDNSTIMSNFKNAFMFLRSVERAPFQHAKERVESLVQNIICCVKVLGLIILGTIVLMCIFGGGVFCNLIGLLYPAYATMTATEAGEEDTRWIAYWMIYIMSLLLEYLLYDIVIHSIVPFYWMLKCGFLMWCFVPMKENGSTILYDYLVHHKGLSVRDILKWSTACMAYWLAVACVSDYLCNIIGFLFPIYASFKATETQDYAGWLTYWVIYTGLSLVEYFPTVITFTPGLPSWLLEELRVVNVFMPGSSYWLLKAMLLTWCFMPSQLNGSVTLYNCVYSPLIHRFPHMVVSTIAGLTAVVAYLFITLPEFVFSFAGFLYPAYASLKGVETADRDSYTRWLVYWMVYLGFDLIEFNMLFIDSLYWLLKCLFLIWCLEPSQYNGCTMLHKHLVRPCILPFILGHQDQTGPRHG